MSQPAQCVILWITIFVATLKHRGKKGEAELRVWVSEAQDGGTDTKKKGSNQRCVSTANKSLIGQVIMQKKRKKKTPQKLGQQPQQADWNNSRAETAATQVISSPLISLGVSQHTHRNIYQLGSSTASDSLYVHTVSLISPSITHLQLMLFNS